MPRRSSAQVAARRSAILNAAVAEVSVSGFEGASIGQLAGELEMSKSGLIGHFGDKQQLQLATLHAGLELFAAEVWHAAEHEPPGRRRLLALCDAWLNFFEREILPGGCLMTTATVEFDARPGPVRDAIAAAMRRWLDLLEREAAIARSQGELADDVQPADVAFQLNALASAASSSFQLHRDHHVFQRARRLMRGVIERRYDDARARSAAADSPGHGKWRVADGFDLDRFLGQPLVARVATAGRTGPTVRPLWYLWEEQAFWWLTGGWSKLGQLLARDPRVALVVDTCDLQTGEVRQVTARGSAVVQLFDANRARRWGSRYLGPDERHWGRLQDDVFNDPTTRLVVLEPTTLRARDMSF